MRPRMIWLALAFTLPLISPSIAQQRPADLASDPELLAAYCLGRVQQEAATFKGSLLGPDASSKIKAEMESRTNRFKQYLHAKGYSSIRGPIALDGITRASIQGRNDQTTCYSHAHSCVATCSKPENKVRYNECMNDCMRLERACAAVDRCFDEAQLPF